jgi:hypothetical protein
MAIDVDGDVAASMFARQGVACIWQETHVLALRDGQWARLGGGGASGKQDMLADRSVSLAGTEQAAEHHGKIVGSIGAAVVQALDVIAQPSHQLQSCARQA